MPAMAELMLVRAACASEAVDRSLLAMLIGVVEPLAVPRFEELTVAEVDSHGGRARAGRIAHVNSKRVARTENRLAVVSGVLTDVGDFGLDGRELSLQSAALRIADRAGGRFRGQADRAVQESRDLREGAIGDLEHADAVSCVPHRLSQGGDVRLQAVGDCETSRIICAGIDALTGGEGLQRLVQGHLVGFE